MHSPTFPWEAIVCNSQGVEYVVDRWMHRPMRGEVQNAIREISYDAPLLLRHYDILEIL